MPVVHLLPEPEPRELHVAEPRADVGCTFCSLKVLKPSAWAPTVGGPGSGTGTGGTQGTGGSGGTEGVDFFRFAASDSDEKTPMLAASPAQLLPGPVLTASQPRAAWSVHSTLNTRYATVLPRPLQAAPAEQAALVVPEALAAPAALAV